jgi:hypothetical protein
MCDRTVRSCQNKQAERWYSRMEYRVCKFIIGIEILTAVNMMGSVCQDITPCTPVKNNRCYCLGYSITLNMEAMCSSET